MLNENDIRDSWAELSSDVHNIYAAVRCGHDPFECQTAFLSSSRAPVSPNQASIVISKKQYAPALPIISGLVPSGKWVYGIQPAVANAHAYAIDVLKQAGFEIFCDERTSGGTLRWDFPVPVEDQLELASGYVGNLLRSMTGSIWGNIRFVPERGHRFEPSYCQKLFQVISGGGIFEFLSDLDPRCKLTSADYEWLSLCSFLVLGNYLEYVGLDDDELLVKTRREGRLIEDCLRMWRMEFAERGIVLSGDDDPERQLETLELLSKTLRIDTKLAAVREGVPITDILF